MGSRLSGNYNSKHDSRPTTNDFIDINIQRWHRYGKLEVNNMFWEHYHGLRLQIEVNVTGLLLTSRENLNRTINQFVFIERCGSRLSTNRVWMCCPKVGCNKRVATLYFKNGFYCRHCLRLSYSSQKLSKLQRQASEYKQLEDRLMMYDGYCVRPKGMHRKTYLPLAQRARYLYRRLYGPINAAWRRIEEVDRMMR